MIVPARRRHRDRGASVVEAALVVPLVLLLLGGVVDVGFAMVKANDAAAAVRVAAQAGAREGAASDADWAIVEAIANSADNAELVVDTVVVYAVGPGDPGTPPAQCLTATARTDRGVHGVCNVYTGALLDQVVDGTLSRDEFRTGACHGGLSQTAAPPDPDDANRDGEWCPERRTTRSRSIGVEIRGQQPVPFGLLGTTRQVVERGVFPFDYDPDNP